MNATQYAWVHFCFWHPVQEEMAELAVQKSNFAFSTTEQGSNYTKAMATIASVPFDLAVIPHNINALLCM